MAFECDFPCDTEFSKLLARRSDIDLTVAALELARDAYPDIDFSATMRWIADVGRELHRPISHARTDRTALKILAHGLAEKQGLLGDIETYGDPDNSYLHRVIERRRGIPISLSVIYMAVAARAGITLDGVSAPAHFLTRYEAADGPLFVDPFCGGCLLSFEQAVERVAEITDLCPSECGSLLEPATPREIVIRMLNNLKSIYLTSENWTSAWMVQHRLALLLPGSYAQRRDLGLIALKADRPGQAIDMLECCLNNCPEDEKEQLTARLDDARRELTRWN